MGIHASDGAWGLIRDNSRAPINRRLQGGGHGCIFENRAGQVVEAIATAGVGSAATGPLRLYIQETDGGIFLVGGANGYCRKRGQDQGL